jgi:oxalate decarboxylase
MGLQHLFHLFSSRSQKVCAGGTRVDVTARNFPVLKGMALSHLTLKKDGFREPHWHPNAHELSYCIEGKAVMTIFSPGAGHDTFTIQAGDITFVPMGFMHHIENIGDDPLRLLVCFNHEMPEDIDMSTGIDVMPDHILGATFNLDANFFAGLKQGAQSVFISQQSHPAQPEWPSIPNRHKFNLEGVNPQIQAKGGWVKISNQCLLEMLQHLSVYSVNLEPKGAREPHWHPNADELNFLLSGKARITLLSPGGSVDTFDMVPGDLSFLPRGYLHHIENTGNEPARFAIFFNHQMPSDIGISGCLGAYSNALLAALFGVPVSYFDKLPKYQQDLFVVSGAG